MIHRDIGEHALPSACRHFPRKVLHDPRGSLISLSHFCPTAAAMLLADGAVSIVDARPPLLLDLEMEGLDARRALPPLLRPGLLCDMEGYDAWERAGVARFAPRDCGYTACLNELAAATEAIRQWKPGARSLSDCVLLAFAHARADTRTSWSHGDAMQRVTRLTAGCAGEELKPIVNFEDEWETRINISENDWFDRGMKNYLAARLFGNWIAYQGQGLRTIVEWLRTCTAVVHHFVLQRLIRSGLPLDHSVFIESVRSTDLLLLHVLDGGAFAKDVARVEESSVA
jgi:hypothetical protein